MVSTRAVLRFSLHLTLELHVLTLPASTPYLTQMANPHSQRVLIFSELSLGKDTLRRIQGRHGAVIRMEADSSFLFWLGSHLEGQTQLQRFEWTRLWAAIWQVFWCLCTNECVTATLDVLG